MDIKQLIALAVRVLGTGIVAWLAAKGQITTDEAFNFVVMGIWLLGMLIWSIIQKITSNNETQAALKLPAGSSIEKLKEVIKG